MGSIQLGSALRVLSEFAIGGGPAHEAARPHPPPARLASLLASGEAAAPREAGMSDIALYLRSVGPGWEIQHVALIPGGTLLAEYFRSRTAALCGLEFGRSAQYSRRRFRAAAVCARCHALQPSLSSPPLQEAGKTQGPAPSREQAGTPLTGGST